MMILRAMLWAAGSATFLMTASFLQSGNQNSRPEKKIIVSMKDDLANRAHDIHWPDGFDPANADLFSHNELVINAPCPLVWQPALVMACRLTATQKDQRTDPPA